MALIEFKDRIVEHQGRKVFTDINTGEVLMMADETLDEGEVYEQGVLGTAANLNKLAQKEYVETALSLKADASDVEGDINTINNSIIEVKNNATALQTRVDTAESNATALQTRVGTAESNATALQTRVGTVETNATSLQTRVGTVEGNTSSLQTKVGTVESNAVALQTRVASAETKITNMGNEIADLETKVIELIKERDGSTFNFRASRIKQPDGTFLQSGSYTSVTELYASTAGKNQFTDEFDIDISIRGDYLIVRKLEVKGNWYFYLTPNNTHKVLLRLPLAFPKIRSKKSVSHDSTGVSSTMSVGSGGEIYGFVFTLVGYELKRLSLQPGKYLMISI